MLALSHAEGPPPLVVGHESLHLLVVGEVVERSGDVTGLAVNIAARVMDLAAPGEVLLTRTLMDLTGGSGLDFEAAGSHELKGLPGVFELFRPTVDSG